MFLVAYPLSCVCCESGCGSNNFFFLSSSMEQQHQTETENIENETEQQNVAENASHLTKSEVLRRRLNNLKRLSKSYRGMYWGLMEELKTLYKDYVWESGLSPFEEDDDDDNHRLTCAFRGCESNAMPLTIFCHLHILSDPNQKLYVPCNYIIKSSQAGPITCEKPILRTTVPSLCDVHMQKAEKHLTRALKRNGASNSFTSKRPPQLHVILVELVNMIQARRRELIKKEEKGETVAQNENDTK